MMHSLLMTSILMMLLANTRINASTDCFVYIGTYTNKQSSELQSKGIYLLGLDSKTGKIETLGLAAEVTNPSFIALAPSRKFLYSVSESDNKGAVSSFAINSETGMLTLLNHQLSQGQGPCHVTVDSSGKTLLVANYGSGHIASFPIQPDGSLGKAASVYRQGPASNIYPKRQEAPHAHSIFIDASNKFALACDLGSDAIFSYRLDSETSKLTPNEPSFASVPPGGGPRHLAFHPNGKWVYVNNEMAMTVSHFLYDATKGSLNSIETISSLPTGLVSNPRFSTAEIQVHPEGNFVYASNRGHDTIACFKVDSSTGRLCLMECTPALAQTPRNFGIDPTGKWLIAAGQTSNNIVVFSIDRTTGKLTPTDQKININSPVCVKFLNRRDLLSRAKQD